MHALGIERMHVEIQELAGELAVKGQVQVMEIRQHGGRGVGDAAVVGVGHDPQRSVGGGIERGNLAGGGGLGFRLGGKTGQDQLRTD